MDDNNTAGHVATLKYGTGYEVPWLVLRGETLDELQAEIEAATGVAAADMNLAQQVAQASIRVQGIYAAAQSLGATPLPSTTGPAAKKPAARKPAAKKPEPKVEAPAEPAAAPAAEEQTAPWVEETPAAPAGDGVHVGAEAKDPVIAALDAVTDMDAFRAVWQANQAAFKRPEIASHAKATRARLDAA